VASTFNHRDYGDWRQQIWSALIAPRRPSRDTAPELWLETRLRIVASYFPRIPDLSRIRSDIACITLDC
jgi:hypothetical protein